MNQDINLVGEQPTNPQVHTVATGDLEGTSESVGSPLGKFKDASKLFDAYNELQSEFTRKCQKLSEVEKKLQEAPVAQDVDANQDKGDFAWKNNLSEFLQSHERASELVDDIANEILGNQNLKENDNGLEKAYLRVLEKKYVPHDLLAQDNDFLEKHIFSNNQIKDKIIKEYISTLSSNQSPLIVNNSGFTRGIATTSKVNDLEDARRLVESMFKF